GSTSRPVSRRGTEPKPPWSAVPREIKEQVATVLGSPVARAERVYGGYAPSATFRLRLKSGRRAFFKADYPAPKGSGRKGVTQHREFASFWRRLAKSGEIGNVAALAGRRRDDAEEWIDVALPVLRTHERRLASAKPPFALLHFDTRSDNTRLQGDRLRIFDWPFARAGPAG